MAGVEVMAQPRYGFGECPVASPHPVFGKKPGLLARVFGTDDDKYWPTDGDVQLYKEHMRRVRNNDYGTTPDGHVRLPFDPELVGLRGESSKEVNNRIRVKMVRDEYRHRSTGNRSWWEID